MLERLRQVAFMVRDLEEGHKLYRDTLGMESCFSEDLTQFGLKNLVLPAGEGTFVELLQPTSADTPGGRFLERRGEAPYLLIFESKKYHQLISHLKSLGVRITGETEEGEQRSAFIHPSSANGALLEIIEASRTDNPWPAAGPDWQNPELQTPELQSPELQSPELQSMERRPKTRQLRQVAVLVRDLDQAVARWGEMFGLVATSRFQVSFTDLEIAVMPMAGGDTFIELAQPTSGDVPSARFLEKYGEGIYLIIYQIDDSLAVDAQLKELGLRYTSSRQTENYRNMGFNSIWLHPSAMKGAFTQLSQVLVSDNPWPPAGDSWHK